MDIPRIHTDQSGDYINEIMGGKCRARKTLQNKNKKTKNSISEVCEILNVWSKVVTSKPVHRVVHNIPLPKYWICYQIFEKCGTEVSIWKKKTNLTEFSLVLPHVDLIAVYAPWAKFVVVRAAKQLLSPG